jgi:glycerol-3-phosphate dehydrogenase
MARDVVNKAILVGDLPERKCITETLPLHGYKKGIDPRDHFSTYGSDVHKLKGLIRKNKTWDEKIHPRLPYFAVEVIWAVRFEMARSVEDVLARRTRSLLLDAYASMEAAKKVAHLMAKELGYSQKWEKAQVKAYEQVAKRYIL